jgi:galactoside 2-L-fucosyltransferase 1/2
MFILATGYGLARIHSCYLYISYSILNEMKSVFVFNLQNLLLSHTVFESIMKNRSHPIEKITREIGCRYLPELTHPNAMSQGTIFEMRGYWQTYLHFANYTNELREHIFVANESVLEKVAKFFLDLYQRKFAFAPQFSLENHPSLKKQLAQSNHTTWIGIHVRRSDFVQYKAASSDEYLFNAIEYYTRRYPNAHFVVASDDKSYCKKLFHDRSNVFLTPRSFSPGDDLITLSLCQHSIITGGTFGWWTAYLANGEVVHDTAYPTTCEKDEYYYPSWFKSDLDIILDKHTS